MERYAAIILSILLLIAMVICPAMESPMWMRVATSATSPLRSAARMAPSFCGRQIQRAVGSSCTLATKYSTRDMNKWLNRLLSFI